PSGPGGPGPGGRPPENRPGQPQGPRPGGPGGPGPGPGGGRPTETRPGQPQGPRPAGPGPGGPQGQGPAPGKRAPDNRPGPGQGQRPPGPGPGPGGPNQQGRSPENRPAQPQGPRPGPGPDRPSRPSVEAKVPGGSDRPARPSKESPKLDDEYKAGTDYKLGIDNYENAVKLESGDEAFSSPEPKNAGTGENIRPYPAGVAFGGPTARTGEQAKPAGRRFDNEDLDLPAGRPEGPALMGGDIELRLEENFTMAEAPPGFNDDPLLSGSRGMSFDEPPTQKPEPLGRPRVTFDSPRVSGSRALGALLDSMDDDEEEEEEEEGSGNQFADQLASSTGISVLKTGKTTKESDAAKVLETMMSDPSPKTSINKQPAALNSVADGVSDALDRLLDEKSLERKLTSFGGLPEDRNKRVVAADVDEDEEEEDSSDLASQIDKWLDEAAEETAGDDIDELIAQAHKQQLPSPTSTQDALSRLLEAASKAPDKPGGDDKKARKSAQDMASAVNKPPMKISRQFAKLQESDILDAAASSKKPSSFDEEPRVFEGRGPRFPGASSGPTDIDLANPDSIPSSFESAGTGSTIDQDAVNARIAALQKKMEEQSKSNISLDQLPDAPAPEPSILPDHSNRRDVVNRIMEEAANRGRYQEPSPVSERMDMPQENISVQELERLSTSRLQQMAEMEAKGRQTRQQMRSKSMGPSIDAGKIAAIVAVIVVGVAGIFFREPILKMVAGGNNGDVQRDAQVLAKVDELEKSGKLADAMKYLESEEKDRELTQELWDRLDTIYFKLAKYYYEKAGQQQVAISLLETKINSQSPRFGEAQKLIQEYKKPKKQGKPAKKKRRKR
ncbi:MAG: hypothetical protein K2Z81_10090, partial [Cyanobacteria bacterium]|nr:hypothetical protein [Cyanobacteriota bacterium]